MRPLALAAVLLAGPFVAQPALAQKVWTPAPAPVPAVSPNNTVAPVERAGRANGAERSAPFSDVPNGTAASGGTTSSGNGDGVGTPSVSR